RKPGPQRGRSRPGLRLAKPMNGINAPQRPDCVAGHVGLELRNVDANYPLKDRTDLRESSRILALETIRELRGWEAQLGTQCQDLGRMFAPAEIFCRCRDDPAAANPAIPLLTCVLARTHKRCHRGALERN